MPLSAVSKQVFSLSSKPTEPKLAERESETFELMDQLLKFLAKLSS